MTANSAGVRFISAVVVLIVALSGPAKAQQESDQGRYVCASEGFSIIPPKGLTPMEKESKDRIVMSFIQKQPDGTITFDVFMAVMKKELLPALPYEEQVKKFKATLKAVDQEEEITVGKIKALRIVSKHTEQDKEFFDINILVNRWTRMLTFQASGLTSLEKELRPQFEESLKSLEFTPAEMKEKYSSDGMEFSFPKEWTRTEEKGGSTAYQWEFEKRSISCRVSKGSKEVSLEKLVNPHYDCGDPSCAQVTRFIVGGKRAAISEGRMKTVSGKPPQGLDLLPLDKTTVAIDTGKEKVVLAFRLGSRDREAINKVLSFILDSVTFK